MTDAPWTLLRRGETAGSRTAVIRTACTSFRFIAQNFRALQRKRSHQADKPPLRHT